MVIMALFYSRLDHDSGQLSANGSLVEGEYKFRVRVHDVVMRREVISSVTVKVKDITDEAVINSGSLRIKGIDSDA